MRWAYLSVPKLQRCNHWSWVMDKKFHPTFYWACDCLSILELNLIHITKRGSGYNSKLHANAVDLLLCSFSVAIVGSCFRTTTIALEKLLEWNCTQIRLNQLLYRSLCVICCTWYHTGRPLSAINFIVCAFKSIKFPEDAMISAPSCVKTLRPRQMDAISQTTFSNAFSWMKMFEFQLKFHWSLFPRVQLTIFQQWFI